VWGEWYFIGPCCDKEHSGPDYIDDEYNDDPNYMDARPRLCEYCGGEIAGSYSTCICDEED
jgi:hypothetical protein